MVYNNYEFINKFRIEREMMMDQIKNYKIENDALDNLAKYRQLEFEVEGYKKSLEILSDTTYQDRKHFLLELIQNADDASFDQNKASLNFTIYNDRLELQYNENGFELEDILAITDTGNSTKTGIKKKANSFIGEKGIGFKSVFALAKSVEIHSSDWHFKLKKESCIIPQKIKNRRTQEGTKIVIHFLEDVKNENSIDIIADELYKYFATDVETFLFLQQLSEFNLVDARKLKDQKSYSLEISPNNRKSSKLEITSSFNCSSNEYVLYSERIIFPKDIVAARWEKIGNEIGEIERTFTIASKLIINDNEAGRVFCFLPTNVLLPVPIYLQIDGHTKADRESLHDPSNNIWNKYLLSKLPEFLNNSILEFRKEKSISDDLYKLVPYGKAYGQFSEVINQWIECLKGSAWVKTYSEEWVTPEDAIIPNQYIGKIINKYQDYREAVEKKLRKKFVNHEWLINKNAYKKLTEVYSVCVIDEEMESEILSKIGIPKEILSNQESLKDLYNYIVKYDVFSNKSYLWRREEKNNRIKNNLSSAPIFPIEGEGFSFLKKNTDDKNIFWISTKSKRETGLGSSKNENQYFRIVDPQYTYTANEGGSNDSKEYKEKADKINDLNRSLKQLLEKLKIEELDEDTLLQKVQIPLLLKSDEGIIEVKYNVLYAIFKFYRLKKNFDSGYLKELKKIEAAVFLSVTKKQVSLVDLLLPKDFIVNENDTLFEVLNLDRLYIPHHIRIELRKEETRQQFKQFLIHCGIRYLPKFELIKKKYEDIYHFSSNTKELYNAFLMNVRNEYTASRKLEVSTYNFDFITCELLKSNIKEERVFAKLLYEAWNQSFNKIGENKSYLYNNQDLIPGYVKIDYFRTKPKSILIRLLDNFFGEKTSSIPLITIDNRIAYADRAFRIKVADKNMYEKTSKLFLLVVENGNESKKYYDSKYLDSLNVNELKLSSINSLWDKEPDELLVIGILEMVKLGYANDGLLLKDKKSNTLKPITEFKLGKGVYPDIPMIEEQYGENGRLIGIAFALKEEFGVSNYQGVFEQYFSTENKVKSDLQDKIFNIFKNWKSWNIECKKIIIDDYKNAIHIKCNDKNPIFIFNDMKLAENLASKEFKLIYIEADPIETYDFDIAAKEIGLLSVNDLGKLITEGDVQLDENERSLVLKLTETFFNSLQVKEKSRMLSNLSMFGHYKNWTNKIIRVKGAKRVLSNEHGEIVLPFEVPFIDDQKNVLYIDNTSKAAVIVAQLLSESGVVLYKNIIKELDEIEKSIKEIEKMKDIKISKEAFKNSILSDTKLNQEDNRNENNNWRLGLDPELYGDAIEQAVSTVEKAIDEGVSISQKRHVTKEKEGTTRKQLSDLGYKIQLKSDFNGKVFLKEQYHGRCQICGERILLLNGEEYFECFHINESKGETPDVNMPFNILSLCPNCVVKAKQKLGRELKNLKEYSILHKNGEIFTEEVEEYFGDYYRVPVQINGKDELLTISPEHLSYFVALFED
jgi:Molecular chaperone, HSP90 family